MRIRFVLPLALVCALGLVSQAAALSLFVDAAPNRYGSADYAPWEAETFQAVAAGTFVNMAHSTDPDNVGTTDFEIQDEVVYSFGDLGKRLTWIYWLPDETVAGLDGRFAVSLTEYWGSDPAWDFYDSYYGSTWLQPTSWIDYDDGTHQGVIGTAGMAWWGAYGVNTQEALAADIADWGSVAETWVFTARLDGTDVSSITSNRDPVPEPGSMLLLGSGLLGMAGWRRRRGR